MRIMMTGRPSFEERTPVKIRTTASHKLKTVNIGRIIPQFGTAGVAKAKTPGRTQNSSVQDALIRRRRRTFIIGTGCSRISTMMSVRENDEDPATVG